MQIRVDSDWKMKDVDGAIVGIGQNFDLSGFPEKLTEILSQLKEKELFQGKIDESYSVTWMHDSEWVDLIFIGLGDDGSFTRNKLRAEIGDAFRTLKKKKIKTLGLDMSSLKAIYDETSVVSRLLAETLVMSDYAFDDYKSDRKKHEIKTVLLKGLSYDQDALGEGEILGKSNVFSRSLTNMPANALTPTKLAQMAMEYGQSSGFEVEIKDLDEIKALNMEAFLSVAKGSTEPPKLIVMRYNGNDKSGNRLGLVGKGLTYDSGGLSIKPTAGMVNMKDDMGGASAVIGAMGAIAQMGIKTNVTAVVAACENMISGHSYKPGDIISSMGGKSIFIGNTDAEGRLTLVDAVTYIQDHENINMVLDIATLTGAAIHCLGVDASAVLSNDDTFYSNVENAFKKADENQWRMPIFDEYKALIKHEQADLTNSAGSPGTITAGMFIEAFVKDIPWVHIDIAGTAFRDKQEGIFSKGGTGAGVRPLYFLAKKLSK
ncbi:MAG: leucyl aminopeptidase [Bacillota bacterium]|nr:leucyl aminopeptidase [Bacillota bacterium]